MAENAGGDPAGNANPTGGDPADSAGAAAPVWTEALTPDLKGFAETKGWKDPGEVVSGYQNLEKLTGVPAEQLLRMPKTDDADGMGKLYDRLGRPTTPEEYNLSVPEGQDKAFAKVAAGWFHEEGFSAKQATSLTEKWNNHVAEIQRKASEEYSVNVETDKVALTKEWGAAYEKNLQIAKSAAQSFGVEAKTIDQLEKSMGFAGLMRFMHGLGAQLGEDKFLSGHGSVGFGAMSPAAAQVRLQALKDDPGFVKRYTAGDADAQAEMKRLHQAAYPDS